MAAVSGDVSVARTMKTEPIAVCVDQVTQQAQSILFEEREPYTAEFLLHVLNYTIPPLLAPISACRRLAYRIQLWLKELPQPPGAKGHGILGSLPEFWQAKNLIDFVEAYYARFEQNGFCRVQLGHKVFYLVGNGEIAAHVMKDSASFPRGGSLDGWRDLSPGGLEESSKAKQARRNAQQLLTPARIPNLFPEMLRTSRELADLWSKEQRAGRSVDVKHWCARFTLAGMGRELFYTDLFDMTPENEENTLKIIDSMQAIFELLIERILSPMPSFENLGRLKQAKDKLYEGLRPIVTEYWKGLEDKNRQKSLRHLAGDMLNKELTEEELELLLDDFVGFLQAAYETTAVALTWILYELSRHPEIQDRIARQLLSCKLESIEEVRAIPDLRRVIEETLRLHAPIPFLLRDNEDPSRFPYFATEYGAAFILSPHLIGRGEWEDADRFNPDRFTDQMLRDGWQQKSPSYFPFIKGEHMCPGRFFAKQKMEILLAVLLRRFKMEVDEDATPLPVKPALRITAQPSHPIWIRLSSRKKID